MSVSDFASLFGRTALGTRLAHGTIAMTLAACAVCVVISESKAAPNKFVELASTPFLAPVAPDSSDDAAATFKERFNVRQMSLMQDILARPIHFLQVEPLTTASLPRHQTLQKIIPAAPAIVGIASTYDPTDPTDLDAGNGETASGELYDPEGWTAAIRIDLRKEFGGVRYGRNYQPAFALVQSSDKQIIVKINDVGPLKPGRIIDLNKRAMRYFDPTLQLGLIEDVSVTFLAGQDWALGPVIEDRPVSIASRFDQ